MKQYEKWLTKEILGVTKENVNKHNLNWPWIPDHPCSVLVTGDSGSVKPNALLNLIEKKMMIIVLLIKFVYMLKIHMKQNINILLKTRKQWFWNLKDSQVFIDYSNDMMTLP